MSYSTPELEAHIRARALALAEAVSFTHPNDPAFARAKEELRQDAVSMGLPSDTITWFAMQRVAGRSQVEAVLLHDPGQTIPAGALVLVDQHMPAPADVESDTVQSLRAASFIVAPAQWEPVLKQANLANFRVAPAQQEEPRISRRGAGPSL